MQYYLKAACSNSLRPHGVIASGLCLPKKERCAWSRRRRKERRAFTVEERRGALSLVSTFTTFKALLFILRRLYQGSVKSGCIDALKRALIEECSFYSAAEECGLDR